MIKAVSYMAAFYLVYSVMLSSDTLYRRNRVFILISVISALLLPLITIQTHKPINIPVFGKTLEEIIVNGTNNGSGTINGEDTGVSVFKFFWIVYLAGIVVFGLKLFIDFIDLLFLMVRKKRRNSKIIIFKGFNTSGFSALGHVFFNARLTPEEAAAIIRHEQNHINFYHFFDIILIEMVSVFQWFNPFIHMFNRSLRAVHEYQADEGCMEAGKTRRKSSKLLVFHTDKL
jgi:hypothetical protein